MYDLMIDLETLGTDPSAPIISIGAVFFDIKGNKLGETFYMALDINEQIARGRIPTGSTIKWWMGQNDAAKKVFSEASYNPYDVLDMFIAWFKRNNTDAYVWGNGSTFDISIMENIFRDYGFTCPWGYNKAMDLRTFKRFEAKGAKIKMIGTAHNALDDAITQATYVLEHAK